MYRIQRKQIFWRMCSGKAFSQSSLRQFSLLYFNQRVWCFVAMELLDSWRGRVTGWWLRGFSWPVVWADCRLTASLWNRKSGLLIHADGLLRLWFSGADSNRRCCSKLKFVKYLLIGPHVWQNQRQVQPSVQFSLTGHTCWAQRHDTASRHKDASIIA